MGNRDIGEIAKNLTSEQRREYGRRGGLKKGENVRRRKELKETLDILLDMPLKTGRTTNVEKVQAFANLKGKNITVDQAMMVCLIQKALKGDLSAIAMVRDTIGEKPVEKVNMDAKVTKNPMEDLSVDELRELIKNNDTN